MADNVTLTSGTGVTVATDQGGGGEQYQWIKVQFGADGSFTPVDTANGFPVQILSLPPLPLTSTVSTVTNAGTFPVQITSLPPFPTGNIPLPVSGTTIAITSLPAFPNSLLQVSGTTIAITSLPAFPNSLLQVSGTTIAITSLPAFPNSLLQVSGTTIAITSLPAFPNSTLQVSGTTIAITSLPAFAVGSAVTISNLASVPVTVSGTTIAITSLPNFAAGASVTISNLASVPITISGTTIAITSLPPFPTTLQLVSGTTIAITSLPALAAASIISVNNLTVNLSINATLGNFPVTIIPQKSYWDASGSASAAATTVIKALVNSTTAIYITNIVLSNQNTAGLFTICESSKNFALRTKMGPLSLAANGGMVFTPAHPIVTDTNTILALAVTTATNYGYYFSGFTSSNVAGL